MKMKPQSANIIEKKSKSDSTVYSDLKDSDSDSSVYSDLKDSDSDSSVYSDLEDSADSESEELSNSHSEEEIITVSKKNGARDETKLKKSRDEEESSSEFINNPISTIDVKKEDEEIEKKKPLVDEYAEDTSDEEDIRNTVGNIPMHWYDHLDHIGYDVEGNKIMKPLTGDEIDEFLDKMDDPNYWRTVKNKMTGEKVILNDEDLAIVRRLQSGKYPSGEDQFQPWEDFFTYKKMEHPVTNHPPHKRSFIPSKIEKEKVSKLVYAIKMGWIKPRPPKPKEDEFYLLWDTNEENVSKRMQHYIPAPKPKLPGHEESYIPPPEYLFSAEEEAKWNEEEPEYRKINFIPRKYSSLRLVPSYPNFVSESFNRCLDLLLCPRKRKNRVNVDPNDLIPQLPKPKDLEPFPKTMSNVYTGHTDLVLCICVEPAGYFIASGSKDQTIKVWEVLTGRCIVTIDIGGPVKNLVWCPNIALSLLFAAVEDKVYVINPKVADTVVISNTDALLYSLPEDCEKKVAIWSTPTEEQKKSGIRLIITHTKNLKQVICHAKGDYFACLLADVGYKSIVIHQLTKFRSQVPFQKMKGNIQKILFHPKRPLFFVATQKHVRVYNLLKQEKIKVLYANCEWISCMAAHPQGDNLILGGYDPKLCWFDLELSSKPYKTLRHHTKAIRQVAFHKRYPLFASSSDDNCVYIYHGQVYNDLLLNPTIVPVKILKGHGICLDICFHPQRPWIFSASDKTIRLYFN